MEIAPVTPDRWDDLADLFARKGPRGGTPMTAGCWCMFWRQRTGDPAKNRRAMRAIVREGREPGLLAYGEGRAVGWVSVAPREEYGQLVRSRNYGPQDDDEEQGVWSIVCFYVDPRAKKQGVATALLEAAVEHAFARGASAVEAYPHDHGDYMGVPEAYERLDFEPVRRSGKRTIVRLKGPTRASVRRRSRR
jgi:GNAT superfamily N-acetyltransferase